MKKINVVLLGLCTGLFHACQVAEEPALPPELDAVTVADITLSSATLNSVIRKAGNQDIREHGFQYSEKADDSEGMKTASGAIDPTRPTPIDFKEAVSGLKVNTTYYVRSYAVTVLGTVYSKETSFKTLNIVQPGIRTDGPENITHNSARLKGTVTAKGTYPITQYGIVWGTVANPSVSLTTKVAVNGNVTTFPNTFTASAASLLPATTYHFRAYVIANNVVSYGANMTFKTSDILQPGIRTDAASQLSVNSARLAGTVLSKGTFPITEYGLCWGTVANPTTSGSKFTQKGDVAAVPAPFATTVTGLNANTVYYFRAYVTSNNVTTYGADQTFRTPAVIQPGVTTGGARDITVNSARLDGTLISAGSFPITEYGICWGTSANPTTSNSRVSEYGNVTSFPRSFTITAGGLNVSTIYYYRAYVISNGVTTYGSQQSFSTSSVVQPGITTDGSGGITVNSARLSGTLTSGGSYPVSEYGICWSTSANPTTSNSRASEYGNVTSFPKGFTLTAGGLNASVTYHYRAYVIANGVTTYGADQTFRTAEAVPPRLTTLGASGTSSFRFDGRIDSGGSYGISEYGICYSVTNNPTITNSRLTVSGNPGSFPFSYSLTLNNVSYNTYYYYRAYVISNGVVYYGNVAFYGWGKD